MHRILVTGGNGQLGEAIRRATEGSANSYTFATVDELDICNGADVERYISDNKIDTIVNCAAYTDVEGAENNQDMAFAINGTAVAEMAEVYGASKEQGEVAVVKHDGIVVRTSWLYAPWGKNFVLTMLRLGKEREEISVVNDQRGTPTSALGLARAIVTMVDGGAVESMRGIYHYTDCGECTWHDFACEIMREAGLACRVEPCTTAERNMRAARPAYSVLDTARIAAIKGIDIAPWQERLKEIISLINR